MSRRGVEGPMDFEYQNNRLDPKSPWAQALTAQQQTTMGASQTAPSVPGHNPFAAKQGSPLRQQSFPHPPERSVFSPSISRQFTAPPLRNPAFTSTRPNTPAFSTLQRDRFEDSIMSESAVEDSPSMNEASDVPATPDFDFDNSAILDNFHVTTPDPARRNLFSEKKSGKGGLQRFSWFDRDKVRKRKRLDKDRDIGSTRSRLPDGRDEDDSDYDPGHKARRPKENLGWLHRMLTSISDKPDAPIVLSVWLQLCVDAILGGAILWMAWGVISAVRGEVLYSSEMARAQKVEEMGFCAWQFKENRCSPQKDRAPALESLCNEWDTCMNQDPNTVAGVKASAGHLADILNEFTSRLSWKTISVLIVITIVVFCLNNMMFSKFRHDMQQHKHRGLQLPVDPAPSQPATMGFPISPDRNQAYIFAPIGQTPRHIRRAFLQEDTESEASPEPRYLPAPRTPSRRSPGKGERSRSPSKRTPGKRIE
ncbi:Nucleus export protein brr6 [Cytospora mali]|uniref:Nucleus export protein brr6 n=1 Tax=Cytospora mali TaxID=578113 RepID=A0A194UR13_CYTMA|nr:Nucleus export protein brr6 [Valsa mali var. pyri (nom. inval.)]